MTRRRLSTFFFSPAPPAWIDRNAKLEHEQKGRVRRTIARSSSILNLAVVAGLAMQGVGCDGPGVDESDYWNEDPIQATPVQDTAAESRLTPIATLENAYESRQSNLQVLVKGVVTSILSDDTAGDRHQRFILRMNNQQTLLAAHNIGIGERVPGTMLNKTVYAFGEYEWNSQGGIVHWTHVDPDGQHVAGWISFNGKRYQ